jgi:uncharacterized protein (DUF433 family)
MYSDRITIDPKVKHGKPCIKGTRIPVYLILDLLAGGSTVEQIIDDYPDLILEDVKACLEYASNLAREEVGIIEPAQEIG